MDNAFGPLVSAEWLAAHIGEVVVADTRWYLDGRSGREAYDNGHIEGAIFLDLDTDLSGAPAQPGGRHPLPPPDEFGETMGRAGIGDDTIVVAYDDSAGVVASRLWWMLDSLGRSCAVLDGGIQAWGGPLTTAPVTAEPKTFTPRPWPPARFATAEEVATRNAETVLIDARNADRFAGVENAIDPRFGHIPGAANAAWEDNVDGGFFRAVPELTNRFASVGIAEETSVIAYCGSGVSACNDLLALRLAGNNSGRLYVGSWSEWGADESRPIESS